MTELSNGHLDDELGDLDLARPQTDGEKDSEATPADDTAMLAASQKPRVFGFDYSGYSSEIAADAELAAERIRERISVSIIESGRDLLDIKAKLDHGKFGDWLNFHFTMSERTAQNMMNAASAFADTPKVVDVLPAATVYRLAAKGTPANARQFVIDTILAGNTLDPKDVDERIVAAKNTEKATREKEHAERQAEAARSKHEKVLRKAGKSDEEIAAELKRWDSKAATNERQKLKRLAQETAEAERAAQKAGEAHLELEVMQKDALAVARQLKNRFADKYEAFLKALVKIDVETLAVT